MAFLMMHFLLNVVQLQTYDKARNALALALSPVVKALVDPDGAMKDIRNLDSVGNIYCSIQVLISYLLTMVFT